MELYLARHAEAKSKDEDPRGGLSDIGFSNIRKVAGFAKKLHLSVDTIYYSNKLRAKQTAIELAKSITSPAGLKERDNIAPMDNISPMIEELSKRDKNLMIVGHLPYLSKLTSALLCGDANQETVSFQNGCIVKLVRNNGANGWSIIWMITPEIVSI